MEGGAQGTFKMNLQNKNGLYYTLSKKNRSRRVILTNAAAEERTDVSEPMRRKRLMSREKAFKDESADQESLTKSPHF